MLMVNKKTKFLSAFTHILNRYSKSDTDEMPLIGALIAYATNMGIGKMAFNSNLEYNQLNGIKNSRLREETLKAANEIIINATAKLPIQKIYNKLTHLLMARNMRQCLIFLIPDIHLNILV
jgi:hypothetical protein